VHASFAGIVTDDAVDHDFFFVFAKPAILSTKPSLGLNWRCRHPKVGTNSDETSYQPLEGKNVFPRSTTISILYMEEAEGKERSNDSRNCV
jgi:hypothetical protein